MPFLKCFFHGARSDPQPSPYLDIVCFALGMVLDRDPGVPEEVYKFFVETIEEYRKYYFDGGWRYIPGLRRDLWRHDYLGGYLLFEYARTGRIKSRLLEERIDAALEAHDELFFRKMLGAELPFIAIESRRPEVVFEVLRILMRRGRPEIDNLTAPLLSRMNVFYPDDVQAFMKEQGVSNHFRLQVRTFEVEENVGSLLTFQIIRYMRDDVWGDSAVLHDDLIQGLRKAVECNNIREWADFTVGYTVNLIYGEEVL